MLKIYLGKPVFNIQYDKAVKKYNATAKRYFQANMFMVCVIVYACISDNDVSGFACSDQCPGDTNHPG